VLFAETSARHAGKSVAARARARSFIVQDIVADTVLFDTPFLRRMTALLSSSTGIGK
jgi:hypothetical protein